MYTHITEYSSAAHRGKIILTKKSGGTVGKSCVNWSNAVAVWLNDLTLGWSWVEWDNSVAVWCT